MRQVKALSDTQLLAAVRNDGDMTAYAELYVRHYDAARAAAYRIAPSLDQEELVSEAFAKILSAIKNNAGPIECFRPYLYQTIRSVAAAVGAQATQASAKFSELTEHTYIAADKQDFDDALGDNQIFFSAWQQLNQKMQAALWYTEVEGLAADKTAKLLGTSASNVAQLKSRARKQLAVAINALTDGAGAKSLFQPTRTIAVAGLGAPLAAVLWPLFAGNGQAEITVVAFGGLESLNKTADLRPTLENSTKTANPDNTLNTATVKQQTANSPSAKLTAKLNAAQQSTKSTFANKLAALVSKPALAGAATIAALSTAVVGVDIASSAFLNNDAQETQNDKQQTEKTTDKQGLKITQSSLTTTTAPDENVAGFAAQNQLLSQNWLIFADPAATDAHTAVNSADYTAYPEAQESAKNTGKTTSNKQEAAVNTDKNGANNSSAANNGANNSGGSDDTNTGGSTDTGGGNNNGNGSGSETGDDDSGSGSGNNTGGTNPADDIYTSPGFKTDKDDLLN